MLREENIFAAALKELPRGIGAESGGILGASCPLGLINASPVRRQDYAAHGKLIVLDASKSRDRRAARPVKRAKKSALCFDRSRSLKALVASSSGS